MLAEDFRRGLAMLEIRLNDEEFEKMWKEVDADGSGELDYYEFLDAFYPTVGRRGIGVQVQVGA